MPKLDFDFFSRKFDRKFAIGGYPEICFDWAGERWCICANTILVSLYHAIPNKDISALLIEESPYWGEEYVEVVNGKSLVQLVNEGLIMNELIISVWNQFDFEDDEDWRHKFSYHDWVYVKSLNIFGYVEEVVETEETVRYSIRPNSDKSGNDKDIVVCDEDDLEYDWREESVATLRYANATYMERVWGVTE